MPLDVLGRMRATLIRSTIIPPWPRGPGNLVNAHRDRDRLLQLLILNYEFLVNASHQPVLITSLRFEHTARSTYRLNGTVRPRDFCLIASLLLNCEQKDMDIALKTYLIGKPHLSFIDKSSFSFIRLQILRF